MVRFALAIKKSFDKVTSFGVPVDPEDKNVNESTPAYHLLIRSIAGRRLSSSDSSDKSGSDDVNCMCNIGIKTTN